MKIKRNVYFFSFQKMLQNVFLYYYYLSIGCESFAILLELLFCCPETLHGLVTSSVQTFIHIIIWPCPVLLFISVLLFSYFHERTFNLI